MSDHLNYIRRVSKQPIVRLQKELAKTIVNQVNPHVVNLRIKTIESGTVKRVYVRAKDTGVLSNVGWVVNDDIKNCMECKQKFGWFTRKHHCRTCGDLVCYQCSSNQSLIFGAENLGQQRVCNLCCSKQVLFLKVNFISRVDRLFKSRLPNFLFLSKFVEVLTGENLYQALTWSTPGP